MRAAPETQQEAWQAAPWLLGEQGAAWALTWSPAVQHAWNDRTRREDYIIPASLAD